MPASLSVLVTCKDEQKNIEACIRSVRAIADEVLVADSGSTDGTLELAHQLADRVVSREYVNSGDFKNWAIPQCAHSWVFIIDADERMTRELAGEIRSLLAADPQRPAYSIKRRNFFLGHPLDHGDWARDRVVRLVSRECRYALHTDHAEIDVPPDQLGRLRHCLVHYTAWDLSDYLRKMTGYAAQQAALWHRQGKKPRLRHLVLNAPLRFLRSFVVRGGFLDGRVGFLVAALTAYYSFLKQALFWQRAHALRRQDLDHDYAADGDQPWTGAA